MHYIICMIKSDHILSKLDYLSSLVLELQRKQEATEDRLTARIEGNSALLENKITLVSLNVEALDHKIETLDHKIETLDHKIETLDHKIETLDHKIEAVNLKIDSSQEDTIDALSNLIHKGYTMHEERIKRLEEHTKIAS